MLGLARQEENLLTIADSNAFRDPDRVLPQHQAALTLLQAIVSAPGNESVKWLDLACGRGQILGSLDKNLSPEARGKIEYVGYDLNQEFARETTRTAARLGFASLQSKVGELSEFDHVLATDVEFDFITLTNTVHEVEPSRLAALLVGCMHRLSPNGTLFIYDMELIDPPELGALPWRRDVIRKIVFRMLDGFGAKHYRPEVGLWHHRSCNGWNVQIQREYLELSQADVSERSEAALQETRESIVSIMRRRLAECWISLETLTVHGAETAEEQEAKGHLLFEFWALSRSLGQTP
jgi:Methyltransferase domain.